MFGGPWLVLVLAMLLPALALRSSALLLVSALVFFTGALARLWDRYLFARVEYTRSLSAKRVFFGETIILTLSVANRKLLPLPWFRIEEEVPEELDFGEETLPAPFPSRAVLASSISLRWYNRVSRRYTITCNRRGSFQFGPAKVEAGDLFGFLRRSIDMPGREFLLVYPRIVPLDRLGIPSRELFGNITVRKHFYEDPIRVIGTREYIVGDPMRRVHWKATARTGRLMTKIFEPSTSVDAALFLDARTVAPPYWGFIEDLLETAVITAASIANYGAEHDIRVGLYVNQTSRYVDRMIQIPPSGHPEQLLHILEALSQVHSQELVPVAKLLQEKGRTLPWNTTLVVITAVPTPGLVALLAGYRRVGRRVALVLLGNQSVGLVTGGVPTYRVGDPALWERTQAVTLSGGYR